MTLLTALEALFACLAVAGVFLLAGVGVALLVAGVLGVLACEHLGDRT